jgi:hypothetical protein
MRRAKAPRAKSECAVESAVASTVATLRRAQEVRRKVEEGLQLLVQYPAPRSIADLFAQPGSASDPRSLQGAGSQHHDHR